MPMPVTFNETEIEGVLEVQSGTARDRRGFFREVYSKAVWEKAGFAQEFVQDNVSLSVRGTLRGMHYQLEPHGIGKLVRVITGRVFDVAVDLRQGSPTFGKWIGRTLDDDSDLALWVPTGFAHGFLALENDTIVYYKCTHIHTPEAERALSYRDPDVAIAWPETPTVVSDKDEAAPLLKDAEHNFVYGAEAPAGGL